VHAAIWGELDDEEPPPPPDKPLTVASYDAGPSQVAYLYPLAVGDVLPDAELFFMPGRYINAPLEATYGATWKEFPAALKGLLEGPDA
jgi:hypothetical protein